MKPKLNTVKLRSIAAEVAQIQYVFEVYSQESITLRRLQDILLSEEMTPLNGSEWTTAKLPAINQA